MRTVPIHPRQTQVRRTIVAALAVAAAVLATATVVARPAPAASPLPTRTEWSRKHTADLGAHIASAGDDTGPGFAESEVARLPESR